MQKLSRLFITSGGGFRVNDCDMTSDTKPRALVLGHSFVRRQREFINRNLQVGNFNRNLRLSRVCDITFMGIGGRTVDKMIRYDLDAIRGTAPKIVVLELGSNDLCDRDCDAETTALAIVALAELLLKDLGLHFIVLCEVIPRQRQPFEGYNERVVSMNKHLKEAIKHTPRASCWQHRGLVRPSSNIYAPDGVHLNDVGNKALYKSYRGAILFAISQ